MRFTRRRSWVARRLASRWLHLLVTAAAVDSAGPVALASMTARVAAVASAVPGPTRLLVTDGGAGGNAGNGGAGGLNGGGAGGDGGTGGGGNRLLSHPAVGFRTPSRVCGARTNGGARGDRAPLRRCAW